MISKNFNSIDTDINDEVKKLDKILWIEWVIWIDIKLVERILQLREYFSGFIIEMLEDRYNNQSEYDDFLNHFHNSFN